MIYSDTCYSVQATVYRGGNYDFEESYTLHNGAAIPKLALGTWFIDDDRAAEAVRAAVNIGYRHIDTAQVYGNERGVGEGIRTCGIDRKDIFVTSKVAAENKSYASAMESIERHWKRWDLIIWT